MVDLQEIEITIRNFSRAASRLPFLVARTIEETGNVPIFEALGFKIESRCPVEFSESVAGNQLTEVNLRMKIEM